MILKRQLYTEYYCFEQREYGIGSKILKAGKNKLAKIIDKRYDKKLKQNANIKSSIAKLEFNEPKNRQLTENLIKEIEQNHNTKVFKNNELLKLERDLRGEPKSTNKSTYIIPKTNKNDPNIDLNNIKNRLRYNRKKEQPYRDFVEATRKEKSLINLGEETDTAALNLAHEIGHKINREKPIAKYISKLSNKFKPKYKITKSNGYNIIKKL